MSFRGILAGRETARRFVAAGLLLAVMSAAANTAYAQVDREQQVKAGYLYNFARFTAWGPGKSGRSEAIRVCVLQSDALAPALEETLRGKAVETRPIEILRVGRVEEMRVCHLAYLGSLEPAALDAALRTLAGSDALTVYEGDQPRAGVIRLFIDDRRLRFEINVAIAKREHLELSSRLLNVAAAVLN